MSKGLSLFYPQPVQIWTDSDFLLGTGIPLAIKNKGCCLVLFFNDANREDQDLTEVWHRVGQVSAVATLAVVDLRANPGIGSAIAQTMSDPNNPLYDYAPKGLPSILVYRDGFPQAFYNGSRDVANLVDFILTLACQATYHERQQVRYGADVSHFGISGTSSPQTIPDSSTAYESSSAFRNYGISAAQSATTITSNNPVNLTVPAGSQVSGLTPV